MLNKANKHINFYDIEKVLSDDKRYFIIGALEDIIPFVIKKMEQDNKIREAKIEKQRLKQEEQNLKEVKSKETEELKKKENNK